MPLLVKDRLKGFRKTGNQSYKVVVRRIGAVTLLRERLNVSKLPARRIVKVERHRQKSLTRQGASSEAQFLRTTGGTPSENQGQRRHGKRHNEEF